MIGKILVPYEPSVSRELLEKLKAEKQIPYEFIYSHYDDCTNPETIIGLLIFKYSNVDKAILDKFPNLEFIAVAFTGYDKVDSEMARSRKIKVFNVPNYATDSTAELAVGLSLSLLRRIPEVDKTIRNKEWDVSDGYDLAGKTVGVIGTGTIGTRVAEIFAAFNCKIIGWSRSRRDSFLSLGGKYKNTITEVLSEADIVSVHLALNDETIGVIGAKELAVMKQSAFLVNVARGPVVNTSDLVEALVSGVIAGAAVDVFDEEPIALDNPLLKAPNTILTPHIAYKTFNAQRRSAELALDNLTSYASGSPKNRVV